MLIKGKPDNIMDYVGVDQELYHELRNKGFFALFYDDESNIWYFPQYKEIMKIVSKYKKRGKLL